MRPVLSALHIFPVKSCAPLPLESAAVEPRGLLHDRRWVVTDDTGKFLTGRQHPRLTLLRAVPDGDAVVVTTDGMPSLRLVRPTTEVRIDVTVWASTVAALPAGFT